MAGEKKGSGDDQFSLARKMLSGIGKKKDGSPQEPSASPQDKKKKKSEPKQEESGGDILAKLVGALKNASTPLSVVEPEGYVLLDRIREGETLAPGERGPLCEPLQVALRQAGYAAPDTWRYDDETQACVKKLQKEHGLKESGIMDPKTMDALDKKLGLPPREERNPLEAPKSGAGKSSLPETGNAFIDGLAPGAVKGMHEHGIPASVLIAMSVLESGWGDRLLARDYHNLFGLKGEGTAGSVFMKDEETPGVGAGSVAFKKFHHNKESVTDFARVFSEAEPYKQVMTHAAHPEHFARALGGVYSENPNYGDTLLRIMRQFDLYRFDRVSKA